MIGPPAVVSFADPGKIKLFLALTGKLLDHRSSFLLVVVVVARGGEAEV